MSDLFIKFEQSITRYFVLAIFFSNQIIDTYDVNCIIFFCFFFYKLDCDVNCHKKCQNLTANLCGVNQKLIVEALSSVRRGTMSSEFFFCKSFHDSN